VERYSWSSGGKDRTTDSSSLALLAHVSLERESVGGNGVLFFVGTQDEREELVLILAHTTNAPVILTNLVDVFTMLR
jgi:hypothetical protein